MLSFELKLQYSQKCFVCFPSFFCPVFCSDTDSVSDIEVISQSSSAFMMSKFCEKSSSFFGSVFCSDTDSVSEISSFADEMLLFFVTESWPVFFQFFFSSFLHAIYKCPKIFRACPRPPKNFIVTKFASPKTHFAPLCSKSFYL